MQQVCVLAEVLGTPDIGGGGFRRHRVAALTVPGAVDSLPAVFYRVPVRLEPQTRLFGI